VSVDKKTRLHGASEFEFEKLQYNNHILISDAGMCSMKSADSTNSYSTARECRGQATTSQIMNSEFTAGYLGRAAATTRAKTNRTDSGALVVATTQKRWRVTTFIMESLPMLLR